MQATKSDIRHLKHEGDEDSINFRPSPNFKHMKKYLKSKFEETSNGSSCDQTSTEEEESQDNSTIIMMQPPLPPNPPPPESPLPITLKTEVEDDGYQSNEYPKNQSGEEKANENGLNKSQGSNDKHKIMCRQFARGSCTRGASCIYAHELIVDQLPGIYTFCKNYQNSGCGLSRCKFVHATVFEKEYFYRTGYLPPHCLSHIKENPTGLPPPTQPEGSPTDVPTTFSNPPPPVVLPGMSAPPPGTVKVAAPETLGLVVPATTATTAGTATTATATAATAVSPLKREFPQAKKEFGVVSPKSDPGEPPQKKCNHCDVNEFRLQCNRNKVEKLMRSTQELNKKISQVSKKKNILYTVVITLMRHSNSAKTGAAANLLNNLATKNDKEKDILEKFKMFCSGNSRVSLTTEDNNAKDMSSVLMRMLMSSGEQAPGDAT